jgi:hypothetical protein
VTKCTQVKHLQGSEAKAPSAAATLAFARCETLRDTRLAAAAAAAAPVAAVPVATAAAAASKWKLGRAVSPLRARRTAHGAPRAGSFTMPRARSAASELLLLLLLDEDDVEPEDEDEEGSGS